MLNCLRLSLSKGLPSTAGMGAFVLGSLPIAAAAMAMMDRSWGDGVKAACLFWTCFGLPLMATAYAAAAGAGLRAEPEVAAEALLPVSAGRRALGAMVAAALQFGALAGLILLLSALVYPQALDLAWSGGLSLGHAEPLKGPLIAALLGCIAYFFSCCFAASYILARGVLGAAAGAGWAGLSAWSLAAGLRQSSGDPYEAWAWIWAALLTMLGPAAACWGLARVAALIELRPRANWGRIAAIALALSGSGLGSLALLAAARARAAPRASLEGPISPPFPDTKPVDDRTSLDEEERAAAHWDWRNRRLPEIWRALPRGGRWGVGADALFLVTPSGTLAPPFPLTALAARAFGMETVEEAAVLRIEESRAWAIVYGAGKALVAELDLEVGVVRAQFPPIPTAPSGPVLDNAPQRTQ